MTRAGAESKILKSSQELKSCLVEAGSQEHFSVKDFLFREDSDNVGVFLVLKGKVRMGVKNLPKLDRLFSAGSLLGLPSTFTARPYSLTAVSVSRLDVVHVSQETFLQIMRERPELCREATEMLGREVTFIQSALAERRRQAAQKTVPEAMLAAQ